MAVDAGRVEAEHSAQPIEEFRLWLLVDPDRPVALDVRVPSHRTDAGARPADIAAQEQQVHQLLHIIGAEPVLGHAHAVAGDHRLALHVDPGNPVPVARAAARWSRGCRPTRFV